MVFIKIIQYIIVLVNKMNIQSLYIKGVVYISDFVNPMEFDDVDDFIKAIEKNTKPKSGITTTTRARPSTLTVATKIDRNTWQTIIK